MTTVYEDLDLPGGGTPPASISITLWGAGEPIVGRQISTGKFIGGTNNIMPDAAGYWSADLAGNTDIIPDGTTYKIDHVFGCDSFTSFVSVPVTGGPFNVQQIEVDAMNSIASPLLSVHAGDTTLHGGGMEVAYTELKSAIVVTGSGTSMAAVSGLSVTIPDLPRPVYLYGDAPLAQQSGGPTIGEIAIHLSDGILGIFTNMDMAAVKSLATADTGYANRAFVRARLPAHSQGTYLLLARGQSGNFTVVVNGGVLFPARLYAITG